MTHMQMGNTYPSHVILAFLFFGMFLRLAEKTGYKPLYRRGTAVCFVALSFVCGVSGVRYLLALQCLGVREASLELTVGGGVIDCAPLSRRMLVLTVLAGPLANLLWAALLLRPVPVAALLNLSMVAFNLLPVPPLDGGVAGQGAARLAGALTVGLLLALALTSVPALGMWPLLLCGWVLVRALVETLLPVR